jgi:hypothetical protein
MSMRINGSGGKRKLGIANPPHVLKRRQVTGSIGQGDGPVSGGRCFGGMVEGTRRSIA